MKLGNAVVGLAVAGWLSGCAGTKVTVKPPFEGMPDKCPQKYATVGIKEVPSDRQYTPAGRPVEGFAREVEVSGLARTVYYPLRPDDKVEAVLESKFDVDFDAHMMASFFKGFITGFTLFLLEPIFWYDFDYGFKGEVTVLQNGVRKDTVTASSSARVSMKWLSLGEVQKLEPQAIQKGKTSLFRQLIQKLSGGK